MKFRTNKNMIFIICWITYVAAYLCRVNISSALSKLGTAFHVTNSTLGIIGSLFFITYAIGQLLNGFIGDRVSPYKFLTLAIAGTATLNFIISLSNHLYVIMICWALNGYFQSMFWGPLMRILSEYFSKEHHVNVSTGMTASMVVGYILSWAVLGSILLHVNWTLYFFIPSVCAFFVLLVWIVASFHKKDNIPMHEKRGLNMKELWDTIMEERLFMIAFICVCLGLIKESVSLWAPIILIKALHFNINSSFVFILVIPLANFGGILFARWLSKKYMDIIKRALLLLFLMIAIGSITLFVCGGISKIVCLIMLAIISAMTFGCNSILLSFIPLSYSHKNIVSTLVGVFDFSSYLGAAISAFVLGIILTDGEWKIIPVIWFVVAVVAMSLCKVYQTKSDIIVKESMENG